MSEQGTFLGTTLIGGLPPAELYLVGDPRLGSDAWSFVERFEATEEGTAPDYIQQAMKDGRATAPARYVVASMLDRALADNARLHERLAEQSSTSPAAAEAQGLGAGVVLLTLEQRAELRRLAAAATPGPWFYDSDPNDDWGVVRGGPVHEEWGRRLLVATARAGKLDLDAAACRLAGTDPYESNAAYIAAVHPSLTLGTLRYIEQLEAKVEELRRDQMRQFEGFLDMKSFITTQGEELTEARRRLATLEAAGAAGAERHRVEVLDILRDMRLPRLPLPPEENEEGELNWEHNLICGQNKERQAINDYCRQKAYEYDSQGIGPDPTEVGQWDTRPAAPAPKQQPEAEGGQADG